MVACSSAVDCLMLHTAQMEQRGQRTGIAIHMQAAMTKRPDVTRAPHPFLLKNERERRNEGYRPADFFRHPNKSPVQSCGCLVFTRIASRYSIWRRRAFSFSKRRSLIRRSVSAAEKRTSQAGRSPTCDAPAVRTGSRQKKTRAIGAGLNREDMKLWRGSRRYGTS